MSITNKLAEERRGRLAAERLLELKQAELYAANRKLGLHARALSEQIVETKAEVETVRGENARIKSDLNVATEKMEIAERRLWHSIETVQDGFAIFDSDDRMIVANPAYLAVFEGLEEIGPGVAYARILQLLTDEGIVDTGEMTGPDWRAKMVATRQSESPEPVVIRLWNDQYIKMVDQRGAGGDVVSLGLNITSTVRYEAELKDARLRAEEAARAKSAFLANMSHEIRTPMNGVVGMAELLEESPLDDEQQLYARTIRSSGEALLSIINDILDYSKIDAEKMQLRMAPFDLEKSVHEVLMLLQPSAREKGISLLVDYDMFLPSRFVGDGGRLRQVLTNLVGNAVKFTKEGHVLIRITGTPGPEADTDVIHVSVEDTGIGIPEDKVQHVFGEFNQVDDEKNREFEGTGLGLAISRRLVEMMNGDIWVTSELGVGSSFGFRAQLGSVPDQEERPLPQDALRRVLILDSNPTNLAILKKQVEQLGPEVVTCLSFAEAKDLLKQDIDLFLTEQLNCPQTGQTLTELLSELPKSPPVVLVTDNSSSAAALSEPADLAAILPRPATRAMLSECLFDVSETVTVAAPAAEVEPETSPEAPVLFRRHRTEDDPVTERAPEPSQVEETSETQEAEPVDEPPTVEIAAPPEHAPALDTVEIPEPAVISPTAAEAPKDEVETEVPTALSIKEDTPDLPSPPEPEQCAETRKMRVMAAEDNKTNQLVFRKMVKTLNIDLKFADNGEEAVSLYQSFAPDLIFMDISMPKMDGKEATRAIRDLEASSDQHTPIVALTAHAMSGDGDSILAAGLDQYLTKPLKKKEIQTTVEAHQPGGTFPLIEEVEEELAQASG